MGGRADACGGKIVGRTCLPNFFRRNLEPIKNTKTWGPKVSRAENDRPTTPFRQKFRLDGRIREACAPKLYGGGWARGSAEPHSTMHVSPGADQERGAPFGRPGGLLAGCHAFLCREGLDLRLAGIRITSQDRRVCTYTRAEGAGRTGESSEPKTVTCVPGYLQRVGHPEHSEKRA